MMVDRTYREIGVKITKEKPESEGEGENEFNPDFRFEIDDTPIATESPFKSDDLPTDYIARRSVDDIIRAVKRKKKETSESNAKKKKVEQMEVDEDDGDEEDEEDENNDAGGDDEASDEGGNEEDSDGGSDNSDEDDSLNKEDQVRLKKTSLKRYRQIPCEDDPDEEKFQFAEDVTDFTKRSTFMDFKLSRAVLKALADMDFYAPTPVQSACIPLAMASRDICVCARTGSGKTVAFLVPLMERLLRSGRPTRPMTRALVLSPTRELALQIYEVSQKLNKYCPKAVYIKLSAGGMDSRRQENALRKSPDVVVATPGRLIDHLCNTPNFNLRDIQMLVLDEADKMLDDNFAEQLKEILRQCSPNRQTLLFSATMTESVKDLASVSLRRPARVFINENTDVALRLQQEFVRIRPNQEDLREAMVLSLVKRHFARRTMVFVPTKRYCHRLRILLALSDIQAGELHGNLKQPERVEALAKFAKGETAVLVATDLAARGLDVEGVQTVINAWLPATLKQYVHRVGRTARAGRSGRAVSLTGESERNLLKAIVRRAPVPVKARLIPTEVVSKFERRIRGLEDDLKEVMKAESLERENREAEEALRKAELALERKKEKKGAAEEQRVDWFKERKQALKEAKRATKKTSKWRKTSQREKDGDSD